jgi:hypothetical protein
MSAWSRGHVALVGDVSIAAKKCAILVEKKGPAVWLRDGLQQPLRSRNRRQFVSGTPRGCRTAILVALWQRHSVVPLSSGNIPYGPELFRDSKA